MQLRRVCAILVLIFEIDAHMEKMATMTTPELITEAGYPVETHRVKTQDGYVLQIHRIPAGRSTARRARPSAKGKPAVIIVHGLLGSSGDWVVMGPNRSLAYILADGDYDVWLANFRGNMYTTHKILSRTDPKFWDFSFHEHGKYDLPAMIDKVLKITGLPKILYIGYSMGATSFFAMMSQRPEYNDKLIEFIGLGSATYMDNLKETAASLWIDMDIMTKLAAEGKYSISVPPSIMSMLVTGSICNVKREQDDVCIRFLFNIVGEDYPEIDWEMTPIILARFQPVSMKQLAHFGKIGLTGDFVEYGENLTAPSKPYNLSNVKIPVTLLYGKNDQLTQYNSTIRMISTLTSLGVSAIAEPACAWPQFNHFDFLVARHVASLVNRPLLKRIHAIFNKYAAL